MKNWKYLFFYIAISVIVFTGVNWSSHKIVQYKNEIIEKTNYFNEVASLLKSGAHIPTSDLQNRNIVIYHWHDQCESCLQDFQELSQLAQKHNDNTAVFWTASKKKITVDYFFSKLKFRPDFKIYYEQKELSKYLFSLRHYYNKESNIGKDAANNPVILVIDKTGKLKLYKIGYEKGLVHQIENAINKQAENL